jgi:hypothetical protein
MDTLNSLYGPTFVLVLLLFFRGLFKDGIKNPDLASQSDRLMVNSEWEKYKIKRSWPNLRYYG